MITRKKLSELLLAATLAQTCAGCTLPAAQTSPPWESPLHQDHELVGKIWLQAQSRFISRDELLTLLQQSPLLLLGEKHDNPDHHRLRLALLHDLLLPDGRSLLALEMMQKAQQAEIDAVSNSSSVNATTLATELAWDHDGWPWHFYGPAVMLAVERGAGLRAGNINSSEVMQIYRNTGTGDNHQPLAPDQLAQLEQDIDSSHCGMLPPGQFPAMVRVQQARDQAMADALMSGPDTIHQRILLAGNYHIRHDLGVQNYLDDSNTDRPLSVAFLEVDPEHNSPGSYLQQFSDTAAYDVIWFTPALTQDDYCAGMRPPQAE